MDGLELRMFLYCFLFQEIIASNQSVVTEFLLLGFKNLHDFNTPVILLLLVVYSITVTGNFLIVALVAMDVHFQSAMYVFLAHLSLCDILISTNVAPKTLQVMLIGRCPISAAGCVIQLYIFGASAMIECSLLTVMSYDRYLAICAPLHYASIMNSTLPHYLVSWCWTVGFVSAFIPIALVLQLVFCGPNVIDHFFCDVAPLLQCSCSDTSIVEILVSILATLVVLLQLIFVVVTYICIFASILRISSSNGRQKAFSTCSSHLAVVSIYYGSLVTLYLAPSRGYSLELNKSLSFLNTLMTPLFNPIIYNLRSKEIRTGVRKGIIRLFANLK